MITQKFNQNENEIKIEIAENLEDAQKNGFQNGIYQRFYINGKLHTNYQAMIKFMVENSRKNNEVFKLDEKNLEIQRKEMIKNQKEVIKEQIDMLRKQYKNAQMSEDVLKQLDDFEKKISIDGIRYKL